LTIFAYAKHIAMPHNRFTAFTQQPQIRAVFARLWPFPPFYQKFRKNVYAFVYFGTHLRTFSAAMYTFASLKCILSKTAYSGRKRSVFFGKPTLQIGKASSLLLILTHFYPFLLIATHWSVLRVHDKAGFSKNLIFPYHGSAALTMAKPECRRLFKPTPVFSCL